MDSSELKVRDRVCSTLTKTERKVAVKVVEKAVNLDGPHSMEVPCLYMFTGQQSDVKMLRNLLYRGPPENYFCI